MEKTRGIYKILRYSFIYSVYQNCVIRPNKQIEFVNNFILKQKFQSFLDVGCGTASILTMLPHNIKYVGIDCNDNYIKKARDLFGDIAQFYCIDANNIQKLNLNSFDVIYCGGLLHHLEDEEVLELFKSLKSVLSTNGKVITIDGCYKKNQNFIARTLLNSDRGKNVRFENSYKALAKKIFSNVKASHLSKQLRLPYDHIVMELT